MLIVLGKRGEEKFIGKMIDESRAFAKNVFWFTTLVSKSSHLENINSALKHAKAVETKTIAMGQGNKISRMVAWTFLHKAEQQKWAMEKWK